MTSPGAGASLLAPPPGRYVYSVRSRRTGEVSIGVDLTPNGACPLACDYCQVPRAARTTPEATDLSVLQMELGQALVHTGASAGDVAFAGSGEPTWPDEFPRALALARSLTGALRATRDRHLPIRVFTSGVTLDREPVADALVDLVVGGDGEAWVKLDAWDEPTHRAAWGTQGQAAHERRLASLARRSPIVVQTMLVHREGGPGVDETAAGLAGALGRLLLDGARIDRVVLTTLFRAPGAPGHPLSPYSTPQMTRVATELGRVGIVVQLPARPVR